MDPITLLVCIASGAGLFTGGYYAVEKYMDRMKESRLAEMMESIHSFSRANNGNQEEYSMKLLERHND
jgi:hypothetical protein